MTIKNTLPIFLIGAALILFGFVSFAHANPSAYATTAQTASATTSPAFLVAGTATSSLPIYDSYATRTTAADKVALQVQFTASSTASVLNISYEYTNGAPGLDCLNAPNSCDWYKDDSSLPVTATTSQTFNVTLPNSYSWTFASSSQGGAAVIATNNRSMKVLTVPVLARYVRPVFTISGTAGAVWAQFVPAKENN